MPLLLRSEEHTSELQSPCNLVCLFCLDRKSTRLNSSHLVISYAVFCLKKKKEHLCPPQGGPWRRGYGFTHRLGSYHAARSAARGGRDDSARIFFFFNDTAPPEIYPLSLHDALPI